MTTIRTVELGDSFQSLSLLFYGIEGGARRIQVANPGALELTPGIDITIPDDPELASIELGDGPADGPNEVAILIAGKRFRFWESVQLSLAIDRLWTFAFSAPFEPDNQLFQDAFQPLRYDPVQVTVGGQLLFTGTMLNIQTTLGAANVVHVTGYATPGVLNDCTMPASAMPLEFHNQTLHQIARTLADAFGLAIATNTEPGEPFVKVALRSTQKVLGWLNKLAQQRGQLVTNTPDGKLLLQVATDTRSNTRLVGSPRVGVRPDFSPQEFYSHVTAIIPANPAMAWFLDTGSQHTVKNELLSGVVRPFTFDAGDITGGDAEQAANAKAGRMQAGAVSYHVDVAGWRNAVGDLWLPNTRVKLFEPRAMIYNETEFLIRTVDLSRNPSGDSASLHVVLPGAFGNTPPERYPWQSVA